MRAAGLVRQAVLYLCGLTTRRTINSCSLHYDNMNFPIYYHCSFSVKHESIEKNQILLCRIRISNKILSPLIKADVKQQQAPTVPTPTTHDNIFWLLESCL